MLAYHFVGKTLRDGRPIPEDGEWLVHEGDVVMCESGLHASRRASQALMYAPGTTLCLVECDDVVDEQEDKIVCRRRKIIKRINATEIVALFARKCALSVIHLWNAPDVVRMYLETGDESIRDAARHAAMDAAWGAARDAAWAAAMHAAWDAAMDAACAAAGGAARDAAWGAARDAACDAYLSDFDSMIAEALEA